MTDTPLIDAIDALTIGRIEHVTQTACAWFAHDWPETAHLHGGSAEWVLHYPCGHAPTPVCTPFRNARESERESYYNDAACDTFVCPNLTCTAPLWALTFLPINGGIR